MVGNFSTGAVTQAASLFWSGVGLFAMLVRMPGVAKTTPRCGGSGLSRGWVGSPRWVSWCHLRSWWVLVTSLTILWLIIEFIVRPIPPLRFLLGVPRRRLPSPPTSGVKESTPAK